MSGKLYQPSGFCRISQRGKSATIWGGCLCCSAQATSILGRELLPGSYVNAPFWKGKANLTYPSPK
jgi:hypothetical protein